MKSSNFTYSYLKSLKGHSEAVWTLSQFNNKLLSGSLDGSIKLWDIFADSHNEYMKTFATNNVNTGGVYSLLVLTNNQLAIGYKNKVIKILNLDSGEYTKSLDNHDGCIYSMAALNENYFVSQAADGTIKIWNHNSMQNLLTVPNISNYVSTVIVNNGYIITEDSQNKIGIWNSENGQLVDSLDGHQEGANKMSRHIRALSFSSDKNALITGSNNFDIKLWDIRAQQMIVRLAGHENYVNALTNISDTLFASASGDKSVKIWDIRNMHCVETISTNHAEWIQGLIAFSHEGSKILISGSGDNTIGLFSVLQDQNLDIMLEQHNAESIINTTEHQPSSATNFIAPAQDPSSDKSILLAACQGKENGPNMQIADIQEQAKAIHILEDKKLIESGLILRNKCFYYFKGKGEGYLKCSIHLSSIDIGSISPFLEVIEVLGINQMLAPQITINYLSQNIHILFRKAVDANYIHVVHGFIKKLQEMGLAELHENKNALWFYSNNDGLEILNDSNYPEELKEFLESEQNIFTSYIRENGKYSTLIEVGCGIGENLDIATSNKLNYVGLDFSPNKIIKFRKKLDVISKKSSNENCKLTAECLNIMDFLDKEHIEKLPKNGEPVVIFPFNVFGNIAPISLLLSKLKIYNMDFLISFYKNDIATITMRQEYYTNCGYNKLDLYKGKTGIAFQSNEGLYTVAYNEKYLFDLIRAFGFEGTIAQSEYGLVLYGMANKIEKIGIDQMFLSKKSCLISQTNEELTQQYILGNKDYTLFNKYKVLQEKNQKLKEKKQELIENNKQVEIQKTTLESKVITLEKRLQKVILKKEASENKYEKLKQYIKSKLGIKHLDDITGLSFISKESSLLLNMELTDGKIVDSFLQDPLVVSIARAESSFESQALINNNVKDINHALLVPNTQISIFVEEEANQLSSILLSDIKDTNANLIGQDSIDLI